MRVPTSGPFNIVRAADHEAMSQAAAERLVAQLRRKPDSLLVLATGASPDRTYQLLAEHGRAEPALCRQLRIHKLDEWGGLAMDDPATCQVALQRALVQPLGITPDRFFGFESAPANPKAECQRVQDWLAAHGPADVCVLGLGLNGHLGFNEPAGCLTPGPHAAELSRESREHSMIQQARTQPGYGLTLGIRDILQSREILLLVSGARKQAQLARLLRPEITPEFPASFLWLHSAVTICCDAAALPETPL
jgi:galactosamine-6-phosphate isomerase